MREERERGERASEQETVRVRARERERARGREGESMERGELPGWIQQRSFKEQAMEAGRRAH